MEENINGKNTKAAPNFVQKSPSRLSKIVIDVLAENRIISTIIQLLSKRNERHDEKICLDVSSQTSEDDICHVGEVILDNPGLSMEHSQDLEADNTISSVQTSMSSVDYNNFINTFDDYDVFESSVETVPDVPTKAERGSSFVEVDVNSDTSNCTVTLDIFRKSDPQIVIPPQFIDIINCIASECSTLILNPT